MNNKFKNKQNFKIKYLRKPYKKTKIYHYKNKKSLLFIKKIMKILMSLKKKIIKKLFPIRVLEIKIKMIKNICQINKIKIN